MPKTPLFNGNQILFGIQPSGWSNDDFLDIDIGIPFGQIVSEIALAGFVGCGRGHKYPSDPVVLKRELELRGLKLSEPWVSTYFTIHAMRDQTFASFHQQLDFLAKMGSGDMVVAELGGASHQQPIALVPNAPHFNEHQWKQLADGLNHLGEIARNQGVKMCYHHHMGTGVMTMANIAELAKRTDPALVSMCLDTGHLHFAGGDCMEFIQLYSNRIKHVHLKNIRQNVMDDVLKKQASFKDAIKAGVFTVPGDPEGTLDFQRILTALSDKNYSGWLVVEAEQDPAKAPPLKYALMAREYLLKTTGL